MNDKKRRIGHSMKPREAVDSTAVDTQEPENTPDLGGEEGSEPVVPLDGELTDLGEKEAKSVENGEIAQPEAKVASEVENASKDAEKEENAQPSSLEEMLAASVEHFGVMTEPQVFTKGVIGLSQGFTPDSTVGEVFGGPVTISAPKSLQNLESKKIVFNLANIPGANEPDDPRDFAGIETTRMISTEEAKKFLAHGGYTFGVDIGDGDSEGVIRIYNDLQLGQQADGTYKLVVAIPEGYIEGVKTQAQLDNMTPEEWVSFRLAEYFEQWWFAQGQSK